MYKLFLLTILFLQLVTPSVEAAAKAAFLRDGNIWTLIDQKEQQITDSGNAFAKPQWSPDGKRLMYQLQTPSEFEQNELQVEVWTYHVDTGEKKKIFYDGYSPTWSPKEDLIAFNAKGILNISDTQQFYNVATGVNSYVWLPDGSGFLLSSSGVLRPDGWTSAILFKKKVAKPFEDVVLFGGSKEFLTLPKELGISNNKIPAIYAGDFEYSPSGKWISFTVSPTASLSMDSNMLCVISDEGSRFEVLDEVIFEVGKPKWAPSEDTLAFIAGGGRIVFGFKNKDLKVKEMPANGTYTPEKYADVDFDWVSNRSIVTSRIEEKEWSNDFANHPLPSLTFINIDTKEQRQITNSPEGFGDYQPQYVKSIDKIIWLRGKSITDENRTLWSANPDGSSAQKWIDNVDAIVFYD
ncbi:TolB family protein [Mesobacillus subterraneus]|uniref:TolB domain-containing protein n=1 Tax=Mesobacillus subterraneus TaxID=285983 RepID=A0A3R9EWW7_9BACI|nr:hypothetical protein [Mesobacillus subterraneus]RSD23045.1 hypothetical protein EJA10_20790 [Mesobacillus subterraneus]